jgi:hypothetical protein
MGLERTFREFGAAMAELNDRARELRLAAVVDRPQNNDAAICDTLEYAVEDFVGWLRETREAARLAERAVKSTTDLDQARRALAVCQDRFERAGQVFSASLADSGHLRELAGFAQKRRGEWPSWVTSVCQGIDQCREPVEESRRKLADCWQEIAERAGAASINVWNGTAEQNAEPAGEAGEREAPYLVGEEFK